MEKICVAGGNALHGSIIVQGSKNSALPILAAALLCDGETQIHNCPRITDIENEIKILRYLGCKVSENDNTVVVDTKTLSRNEVPSDLMSSMRSSIIFLSPLLSRMGRVKLALPGGCRIGVRPIDIHLKSLSLLGMKYECNGQWLYARNEEGFKGTRVKLDFPSVGATENIMLAAVCSKGVTIVDNPAREPEISDLAAFLNSAGGRVFGAGSKRIIIEGVKSLTGTEHSVIPDRIAAATYLAAGAVTGGKVRTESVIPMHLMPVLPVFEKMGCMVSEGKNCVTVSGTSHLKGIGALHTMPYPGFPTDCQAIIMAVSCLCEGDSLFVENIFENRMGHVEALKKFGANINVIENTARVSGVKKLECASVSAGDLRAAAALTIAALAARGESEIYGVSHLDRGYENFETVLCSLGGDVKRRKSDESKT